MSGPERSTPDERALDEQLWAPFRQAYPVRDVDQYLALLAPEFVWVLAAEGLVEAREAYAARVRSSFERLPAGVTIEIDFAFTERLVGDGFASERGVARMSGTGPQGALPLRYNHFHTLARSTPAGWRFVLDYDGGPATEADFGAAARTTPPT